MSTRKFSGAFRTFVNNHISSVEQIEVLLILHANAQRDWTIEEISAILRSSPSSIESRIAGLIRAALARRIAAGVYRYAAAGRLHEHVEELQREYGERRFSVIELVFSRADAAVSFAEAFRLHEDEQEGENADNG